MSSLMCPRGGVVASINAHVHKHSSSADAASSATATFSPTANRLARPEESEDSETVDASGHLASSRMGSSNESASCSRPARVSNPATAAEAAEAEAEAEASAANGSQRDEEEVNNAELFIVQSDARCLVFTAFTVSSYGNRISVRCAIRRSASSSLSRPAVAVLNV